MKQGGCWIFLSHSSRDIEKVRLIRNEFEKRGQNPLAFHLRCLNTDTPEGKKELDSLIKREIDCREWFIFCESPDAEKSEYVRMEKNYIIDTGKKKIWSIDMGLAEDEIVQKVEEICTQIKVFISYTHTDGFEMSTMLEEELEKLDFDVWNSVCDLKGSVNIFRTIKSEIDKAAKYGFIIILYTEKYKNSLHCMQELRLSIASGAKIIIIGLGDAIIPDELRIYHCYQIPHVPKKEDAHLLGELIEAELKRKIIGPISCQAEAWNKISEINEKLNYEKRFHPQDAIMVSNSGATDDYIEIYEFPCCGKRIVVGDGPISRFRADGCCVEKHTDNN